MTRQRAAAALALAAAAATLVGAAVLAVAEFPRGLALAACLVVAAVGALYGALRTGVARWAGFACAGVSLAAALALLVSGGPLLAELLLVAGVLLTLAAARAAIAVHVPLTPVPRPESAVLFLNPRSGGGKAERFALADEARARGIEPIELRPDSDLRDLVREAVDGGADALAMAGGDGSQAIVAALAAEVGLPYACIPAGTRNHFALDLGVDRDDVVGALDAFVDGGERRVDLAEVNGMVFVNNVSLGLYAEAVQREGYREAKLRTLLDTVPQAVGPAADGETRLTWREPDGLEHNSGAALLVSNNRYRLGRAVHSGTRPRIDGGMLGVAVLGTRSDNAAHAWSPARPWREWSTGDFQVDGPTTVPAGVDGEALTLETPLRFRSRPGALRVRISRKHPAASPSAAAPEGLPEAVRALVRIAVGREPGR
jgi:diacylglycerol kinase family enzyme